VGQTAIETKQNKGNDNNNNGHAHTHDTAHTHTRPSSQKDELGTWAFKTRR